MRENLIEMMRTQLHVIARSLINQLDRGAISMATFHILATVWKDRSQVSKVTQQSKSLSPSNHTLITLLLAIPLCTHAEVAMQE